MENLLWLLPLLACPIGMVLMMVLMGKGMAMGRKSEDEESPGTVEELRAEHERLSEKIESLERRNGAGERAAHGAAARRT